jgi:type IV pilus assembly protein PilE
MVIIGVLILMAYPEFSKVVVRAKETEAKIQLKHLYALQRSFYYEHDRYSLNLEELGFEQQLLVSEGGSARYKVSVVQADGNGFRAIASAIVDYDKDGIFSEWGVNETGQIIQQVPD